MNIEIGEILKMKKGKKPSHIIDHYEEGYFPYVDIEAFEDHVIKKYTNDVQCLQCNEGDLLIVCDGSRSGLVGRAITGYVGSTLAKVEADGLLNDYLFYFLQSQYLTLRLKPKGTGTPHLNPDILRKARITVPPIQEQERIVSRIEELFSQLDASEATLRTVKDQLAVYRQAVLKAAFDSIETSFYHPLRTVILGSPQNGLYKPKSDYCDDATPILRIDGFYDGFILSDYHYKRVNLSDEEIERYELELGDLVVNRVNSMPYLGKCALVRTLIEPTVFESNMMRIKLDTNMVDGDWLTYYLSSHAGKKELTKNAKQAVNQASINQTDVGNAFVPIPSINDQHRLVRTIKSRLSVCDSIEQTADDTLQQLKAMRHSILKDAFNGTW